MSFMRSPMYAWIGGGCPDDCPGAGGFDCDRPDHATMNLWVRQGQEGVYDPVHYREAGDPDGSFPDFVSGVAMPLSVFDEIAVMRFAQLIREGRVAETVQRVRERGYGNFGAGTLAELIGDDPTAAFRHLLDKPDKPGAELWPHPWPPDEHCYSHVAHELWTEHCYRRCLECGHVFRSEHELVDADERIRWQFSSGGHIEKRPADRIYICPECAHDF